MTRSTHHPTAEEKPIERIHGLSLKSEAVVVNNGTESGYVYFPVGQYQKIQAVFEDQEAKTGVTVTEDIRKD